MEHLPLHIPVIFIATTLLTVYLFYRSSHNSAITLWVLLGWLGIQAVISLTGFYTISNTLPPRFLLLVGPPLLVIIALFATASGRSYVDGLSLKALTILHVIRILVELVLFALCIFKTIPVLMTFEGRNWDILSGITAPIVYYWTFIKPRVGRPTLLAWNLICLGLLINIVRLAILSVPTPFQQFAFDQPNVAILHFPFVWLPGCVVPLVLLSHLAAIRKLWLIKNEESIA